MIVGGVEELSLRDYPGHLAATIFCAACNLRCGYCHNAELVLPWKYNLDSHFVLDKTRLTDILNNNLIDSIVFCGGEPTLYHDSLLELCDCIKSFGKLVKIDTNGTNPYTLEKLVYFNLVDFVSIDVKGPKSKYDELCGVKFDISALEESIKIVSRAKIGHQLRTVFGYDGYTKDDLSSTMLWMRSLGELLDVTEYVHPAGKLTVGEEIKRRNCGTV